MIYDKNADGSPDPKKGQIGRFEFMLFGVGPEQEQFELKLGRLGEIFNVRNEIDFNWNIPLSLIQSSLSSARFQTRDRQVKASARIHDYFYKMLKSELKPTCTKL